MRKRNKVELWLSVATAILGTAMFLGAFFVAAPRIAHHEAQVNRIAESAIELERALGYGGMIHAFKNHVLRPNDPDYRQAVFEQLSRVRQHMEALREIALELNSTLDFSAIEDTVNQYEDMAHKIADMHNQGLTARQIDDRVRVDDNSAIEQLDEMIAGIRSVLAAQTAKAEQLGRSGELAGIILFLMSLSTAAVAFLSDQGHRSERLRQARQEAEDLQALTQIATHDIRAPLRQIGFLVDEVVADAKGGASLSQEAIEDLSLIAERTERLDTLVEKTLGHLQYGAFEPQPEPLDLPALVAEIVPLDLPPDADVEVTGNTTIVADRRLLTVVLRNLLSNAVKHSDKTKVKLRIGLRSRPGAVTLVVEDNGPGVPEDDRERVFELFATLQSSSGSAAVNGVGLATVRRIIRKMGGTVKIGASPLGGAAFHMNLPA